MKIKHIEHDGNSPAFLVYVQITPEEENKILGGKYLAPVDSDWWLLDDMCRLYFNPRFRGQDIIRITPEEYRYTPAFDVVAVDELDAMKKVIAYMERLNK